VLVPQYADQPRCRTVSASAPLCFYPGVTLLAVIFPDARQHSWPFSQTRIPLFAFFSMFPSPCSVELDCPEINCNHFPSPSRHPFILPCAFFCMSAQVLGEAIVKCELPDRRLPGQRLSLSTYSDATQRFRVFLAWRRSSALSPLAYLPPRPPPPPPLVTTRWIDVNVHYGRTDLSKEDMKTLADRGSAVNVRFSSVPFVDALSHSFL